MKLRFTSPIQSRQQLKEVSPRSNKTDDDDEVSPRSNKTDDDDDSTVVRGCQYSKSLVVQRYFVALTLGVVCVRDSEYVLLYDPSVHETDLALLDAHVLTVVDIEGNICLVNSSSSNIQSNKLLQICEACSDKAQAQVAPLLSRAI
jgi:hypothetical protein